MARSTRALVAALVVTLLIAAVDAAVGASVALVPLLLVGPLLTAAGLGWRETGAVGALAVVLAVLLGAVDDQMLSTGHLVAITTVVVGSVLAATVAAGRQRERRARLASERARVRADLLARAGELFETGDDPLDRLDDLAALPVPALADLCVVDLVGEDGGLRAAAVAARTADVAERLRRIRSTHAVAPDSRHPVARVARTGEALLLRVIEPDELRTWATSPEHLVAASELDYRSAIVVPLTARGRLIGTLATVRFPGRRPFGDTDLAVARDLARRAGLAIDHARLGTELDETELEMRTMLGALAEAVTVQEPGGRLVYANDAAARLLGFATVAELLAAPLASLDERWDLRDERGRPIDPERFPSRQALAGVPEPEPLLCELVDRETGERRWRLTKATPVLGPDGAPRLSVNVIEDVTEQRRRELGQAFLARASKLLTESLDPEQTLEQVAWAAVPQLADWCAVDLPDEHGVLRRVATADRSPERTRLASLVVQERSGERALEVGPPQVMRTGRSELYAEITDELLRAAARDVAQLEQLRAVGARSVLVVPMVGTGGVIGTITLGTIESRRRLTDDDVALAEELGRRAGIAVEHARVHGERSTIAATLQAALLPPRLPVIPQLTIAARFRAAGGGNVVGGDFYDLFPLADEPGTWMVVMGDVTGKGPAAAAITALARYTMRTVALYEHDPSRVLERLNHVLLHDGERRRLCTAVCARLRPHAGGVAVTVASAGHPPPLLARDDGAVEPVGAPGTLLGAFDDGRWIDVDLELGGREMLVLYTDGVIDTRGAVARFGPERLEQVCAAAAGHDPDHLAATLDEALLDFQHGAQRDDVAVLVLQHSAGVSETALHAQAAGENPEDAGSSPLRA